MGMQINTNVSALNAYRNLSTTQNSLNSSLEKLSSGLRINRAADDAAGLTISEGLRSQISGLKVAARNAQDGISVVQTAEGALNQVQTILHRMRDLAVQAGNDSNSDDARTAISNEAASLSAEVGRIATSTNFNGKNLLDGSTSSLTFQVGADAGGDNKISVALQNVSTIAAALTTGSQGATFTIATPSSVTGAISFSYGTDGNADGDFGDANESSAGTVTIAAKTGGYASVDDLAKTLNGNSSFAANMTASVTTDGKLQVNGKNGYAVAIAAPETTHIPAGTVAAAGALQFDTNAHAQSAIQAIDTQITAVSTARAALGAVQNRFQYAIDNVNVGVENLSASESRIRDTDMAQEMANYTKAQILQQAGVSMLAQANSAPQSVLKLLS